MPDLHLLDPRRRQVLRFVATYADERGCLPSSTDVALGCGIGSTSTVSRVLKDLAELGLIERDPRYPRLGRVTVDLPVCSFDAELYVTVLAVHESRGNLDVLRAALGWAPDTEAVGFLHREGSARATLLRAYEDAHLRLLGAGVTLSPEAAADLALAPEAIRARHALIDGWEPYCLYSAAITLAARRWTVACEQLGLAHLEPVFVSESVVYDLEFRLDRVVAADFARRRPDEARRLLGAFVASMEHTFDGMRGVLDEAGATRMDADTVLAAVSDVGTLAAAAGPARRMPLA